MDNDRLAMSALFPLLAVATVVAFAGGLGVLFIVVYKSALHEWGVIIIGVALVVLVPLIAALLARRADERE